jgi:hypothetical protein
VALIPIMSTSLSCAPNLRFSRGLTGLLWVRWVSPVLRCAQKTLLTTATAQEAAENKIDLPEDNPAIIDILIRFLYEGEYEPKSPRTIMGHIPLIVPVDERYHQQFPHTCERLGVCEHPRYRVCPHHQCSEYFCGETVAASSARSAPASRVTTIPAISSSTSSCTKSLISTILLV